MYSKLRKAPQKPGRSVAGLAQRIKAEPINSALVLPSFKTMPFLLITVFEQPLFSCSNQLFLSGIQV